MSLLDVVAADGITLRRAGSTSGGEYAGPCPWCGGDNRFHVWPETGRFWCRQCDRRGDAIAYLRERHGMTYQEAAAAAGGTPTLDRARLPQPRPNRTAPPVEWQRAAAEIVDACQCSLHSPDGARALRYLREQRGLSQATIAAARLGYCPGGPDSGRRIAGLWVPGGITIPWPTGSGYAAIKIRRPLTAQQIADGADRYRAVTGSRPSLFRTGPNRGTVVLVEAELDALLLAQEVGDIVQVVAFGTAPDRFGPDVTGALLGAGTVLVAFDADEPGQRAAALITAAWPRARTIAIPVGKDPGEAWQRGVDLRAWVLGHVGSTALDVDRRGDVPRSTGAVDITTTDTSSSTGTVSAGPSGPLVATVDVTSIAAPAAQPEAAESEPACRTCATLRAWGGDRPCALHATGRAA